VLLSAGVTCALTIASAGAQAIERPRRGGVEQRRTYVEVSGALRFPATTLRGREIVVAAVEAPTVRLGTDRDAGFHVTIQAGDFENERGATIPALGLRFRAERGVIVAAELPEVSATLFEVGRRVLRDGRGEPDGGGAELPRETHSEGSLRHPLTVLTGPAFAPGEFVYRPDPDSFWLTIPANVHAGDFTATLTVSIVVGP